MQWRVSGGTDGWTTGPTLPVTAGDGGILSATGVWDTTTATTTAGGVEVPKRTPVTFDARVCFTYPGGQVKCTDNATDRTLTRLPHAFGGGYPTAGAGPGQVALYTGELEVDATDVSVPGYAGDLALSRSHLSLAGDGSTGNWPTDPARGVFGPGFHR